MNGCSVRSCRNSHDGTGGVWRLIDVIDALCKREISATISVLIAADTSRTLIAYTKDRYPPVRGLTQGMTAE